MDLEQTHGGITSASRYLFANYNCVGIKGMSIASPETLRKRMSETLNLGIAGRRDKERQSRIEKLLEHHNVPLDTVNRIDNVKLGMWGVHAKDAEGNIVTSFLDKTQVTLIPDAPSFPVANCANPNTIKFNAKTVPKLLRKTWQTVVVSDIQAGFYKQADGSLQSIHDQKAVDVACSITADVQPRKLMFIGDVSDWAFISRWQMHNEFDAVNESIQVSYDILCQFIAAAGPQVDEKRMIDSNHAQRPEKFLLEHNRAALQIRRASDTSKWPVFSEQWLLRYDELGIQMTGRYPGGEHYLLNDLVLMHAPPKAREFRASVIHGHTHKVQSTPRVSHGKEGRETYFTYDVGCLCSLETNEDTDSLMVTRVPSNRGRTDWQQGIAVVNIVEGKEDIHTVDLIPIVKHQAIYQGTIYG